MNSLVAVVFFAAVAAASAGVIVPSGYVASAYSAPGLVAPLGYAGYASYASPIAHHNLAYSAPLAHHNLAYSAPIAHHNLAYSAPVAAHLGQVATEDTVVAGPSGTVATSKTVGAPGLAATYTVPHAYSYGGLYL